MKFIADFVTTTQIIITCAATHNFPSSTHRYDGRWGTYIRLTIVGKVSEAQYLLSKKKRSTHQKYEFFECFNL